LKDTCVKAGSVPKIGSSSALAVSGKKITMIADATEASISRDTARQ
jgi:hypothetical protein